MGILINPYRFGASVSQAVYTESYFQDTASASGLSMTGANFAGGTGRTKFAFTMLMGGAPEFSPASAAFASYKNAAATSQFKLAFDASSRLIITGANSLSMTVNNTNLASLFVKGTWNQLDIIVDTTQATAADRVKVYVNGTLETSFVASPTYMNQNTTYDFDGLVNLAGDGTTSQLMAFMRLGFFIGTIPTIANLWDAVVYPVDIIAVPGLHSLLQRTGGSLIDDAILTPNWTNNSDTIKDNNVAPGTETRLLGFATDYELGSTDYSEFANPQLDLQKIAYSVWFKRESNPASAMRIFNLGTAATNDANIVFPATTGLITVSIKDDAGNNNTLSSTTAVTDTSAYHHFYLEQDSTQPVADDRLRFWIDGTEITTVKSIVSAQNFNRRVTASDVLTIGSQAGGASANFDGLIYQAAVYSGTLPGIAAVYNAGAKMNIPTTGLAFLSGNYCLDATRMGDGYGNSDVIGGLTAVNDITGQSTTIPS